jgi:hypothetical protein
MQFRSLSLFLIAILAVSGVFFVFPVKINASAISSIVVDMAPESPSPGENTTITLSSYAQNLDSISISWSVNGKVVASGVGKKSLSVTAPAAGAETNIIASLSLSDGVSDIRIVVKPVVMVLLWQADDSYVPPFYKGKAMPTADSEIKVVAMPEIKTGSKMIDPATMVYAWKKDYNNDKTNSGYAKNSFTYTSDYLDDSNNIDVTASTVDQGYSSEENITIEPREAKILFYKNDAVLGTLWEQALPNNHKIDGTEVIEAAPYFIAPADIRIPSLIFNWFINGDMVAVTGFKKNLMPVAVQAGASGTSKIKLEISNTSKIFENVSKTINVEF